jgi:hypothetical protein
MPFIGPSTHPHRVGVFCATEATSGRDGSVNISLHALGMRGYQALEHVVPDVSEKEALSERRGLAGVEVPVTNSGNTFSATVHPLAGSFACICSHHHRQHYISSSSPNAHDLRTAAVASTSLSTSSLLLQRH